MKIDELREKAEAIIRAIEIVANRFGYDDSKLAAVEAAIDERYSLIAVRGGQAWLIMEGNEVVLDFIPEDDFTIGDIIGGYISLYEEE